MIDWEALWAPYTAEDYRSVLDQIEPWDIVLDIGAGDLRLAIRLARIAKKVYAIERNPQIIAQADQSSWPKNLSVICADALPYRFPNDVTVGVLLMRHCAHFKEYAARLKSIGCQRLITNARWKMGVEAIDLRSGAEYDPDRMGWFACQCGSIGFTPGDPQSITDRLIATVTEVIHCPKCTA